MVFHHEQIAPDERAAKRQVRVTTSTSWFCDLLEILPIEHFVVINAG